jgi:hypothetical protein
MLSYEDKPRSVVSKCVRLYEDEASYLEQISADDDRSVSEVIRALIRDEYDRRVKRRVRRVRA